MKNKNYLFLFCLGSLLLNTSTSLAENQNDESDLEMFFNEQELVQSTTRSPRPLSQIAENVTIITKKQILAMNAHSVAEVLNRIPGLLVNFNSRDFVPDSGIEIHNSSYEHVLVLVDGARFNKVAAGINFTGAIPVQIIDRIEVIRGAASSTWGSALGGVINIITKDPAAEAPVSGMASGSYGESQSSDLRTELSGTSGRFGYYLYGGKQQSDGILQGHDFDNSTFFAKLTTQLPWQSNLRFAFGYAKPQDSEIYSTALDWQSIKEDRDQYFTLDLEGIISNRLSWSLGYSHLDNELQIQGLTIAGHSDLYKYLYDQRSEEFNSQLVWAPDDHAVVLGIDFQRARETDHDQLAEQVLPTTEEENWAYYLNDTLSFDTLTITPGLRYDRHSISDDILSPSLGITYLLNPDILVRGLIARGFTRPPMNLKSPAYNYYGINSNPDLQQEKTLTYQAGIETSMLYGTHFKAIVFLHETDDTWAFNEDAKYWENEGSITRKGLELEFQTLPWYNLNMEANFTYVYEEAAGQEGDPQYSGNLIFNYDDQQTAAQLSGFYIWYNNYTTAPEVANENGAMTWDFTLTHTLGSYHSIATDLFFNIHNIFSTSQYILDYQPNAPCWAEAGLRLTF